MDIVLWRMYTGRDLLGGNLVIYSQSQRKVNILCPPTPHVGIKEISTDMCKDIAKKILNKAEHSSFSGDSVYLC